MKTPRDISGKEIIRALSVYGYQPTRQNGSHIRVTTIQNGEHHLAIPNHNPIKTGTLNSILSQVAAHFDITKQEVLQKLFG
jgi:predicted RNA binding protein YcfA (HicA-like mRNA interferase family)